MTVEEIRGGNDEIDRFPIGMRVLAVDDDPTCLKLLDGLLRKCQYQVTTTNQAITALKMLRENRNRFDLIISDVYMPDMDGFKLLELVGLEMDLPVIMLSGNSDPKLVMKGITHGACDYLVKPVRLEELRNIWQHVIRKKVESKSNSKSNNNYEKSNQGSEGGQEAGNEDQSGKISRKRKDEDEEEDNGHESDDPSAQKKPRVVWSIDLHRKFVAAVNQLGIEKAVPKRILDLMNVDGLTRENVASHLQKYRLYLKRISHQANMVVAFGGSKDNSSYMRMGSLDGIGDFRALPISRGLPNSAVSSYSPAGMLGRLNSATGMTLHGLTAQPNHAQNLTKFQPPVVSPTPPNHHLFPAVSPSFDLDHLPQSHKQNTHLSDFNSVDQSSIFPGSGTFSDQPSLRMTSVGSESFNLVSNSSRFLDHSGIQPPKFSSHQIVSDNSLRYEFSAPVTGGFGANVATTATPTGGFVGDVVRPSLSNQNQICGPSLLNQNQMCGPYGNGFSTFGSSGLADGAKEPVCVVYGRQNGGGEAEKSSLRPNDSYPPEQAKGHGGFVAVNNGYDALDDLMNGVMKREQDPTMIMDGEFGFDPYAFGSCI